MKVGVVGVGKSPNVGDQLIAKCLGVNISRICERCVVEYYDLYEGKFDIEFSQLSINLDKYRENKEKKKTYYIPRFIKLLFADFSSAKKNNAMIKKFIEDKDLIIVGGGHLLIDNYGSFAIKIRRLLSLCKKYDKRVVFWGVGVGVLGGIWRKLLSAKLAGLPIYTRDSVSAEILSSVIGRKDISVVVDPAFFSDILVQGSLKPAVSELGKEKTLTLFMMDPYEMARHANSFFTREFVATWWVELISFLKPHYNIIIANNGSPNDCLFIEKYVKAKIDAGVVFRERALNYEEIIDSVNQSDYVVAQRLHAVIPSIALGKSILAIKWDNKVENILKDVGMDSCIISYADSPHNVANKIHSSVFKVDGLFIQRLKDHHISLLKRIIKNEKN